MPALSLLPVLSIVAQISRQPAAPLRIWLRTTGYKLRPPRPAVHTATTAARQDALHASGLAGPQHRADVLVEERNGPLPTIVVGGFVPDTTEALYLMRGGFLQHGSVYYFNYPRRAFSTDLFLAQLEDLIQEVGELRGRLPVLVGVSFGAGLVLELLRRCAHRRATLPLAGLVLISPVLCTADLLDPAAPKPSTLLGRVLKPYLDATDRPDQSIVDKSRTVFLKMFEDGAQKKDALRFL
ncbi:MAG TPA: alpha/beta fold hydrolase, partial [Candidatus Didemnitutus sp.]|nr:alpha/beta fold hydrolase [Candidatus Didemnitutus sp.]